MDPPAQLDDYFVIVDDFLYKSFRDDCKLFFALRSSQNSVISLKPRESSASAPQSPKKKKFEGQSQKGAVATINTVRLSPRLLIREDGSTYGKVKIALNMNIPDMCDLKQKLVVGSDGKARCSVDVEGVVEGLTVRGTAEVNTIAPATEDESSLVAEYFKKDFYCTGVVNRNGFGSTGTGAHFGAKFHDLILGVGLTRKYLTDSELVQRELTVIGPQDEDSQLYVGGGFHGNNWSFGARMIRANDLWSSAQIAMFRKIANSTAVACAYGFDLSCSRAHVTLGASQGFNLRIPNIFSPFEAQSAETTGKAEGKEATTPSPSWMITVPFVGALKADSFGSVFGTIRGVFNKNIQWGIVAKKNFCDANSNVHFGFNITFEDDQ